MSLVSRTVGHKGRVRNTRCEEEMRHGKCYQSPGSKLENLEREDESTKMLI
jgi:hypothetical protein